VFGVIARFREPEKANFLGVLDTKWAQEKKVSTIVPCMYFHFPHTQRVKEEIGGIRVQTFCKYQIKRQHLVYQSTEVIANPALGTMSKFNQYYCHYVARKAIGFAINIIYVSWFFQRFPPYASL
jgi:hypothetical protein